MNLRSTSDGNSINAQRGQHRLFPHESVFSDASSFSRLLSPDGRLPAQPMIRNRNPSHIWGNSTPSGPDANDSHNDRMILDDFPLSDTVRRRNIIRIRRNTTDLELTPPIPENNNVQGPEADISTNNDVNNSADVVITTNDADNNEENAIGNETNDIVFSDDFSSENGETE